MEILMLAVFALILLVQYKINNRRVLCAFLLIMGPYVAITLLNNTIGVAYNFYSIDHTVIGYITVFMCIFYLGSLAGRRLTMHRRLVPGGIAGADGQAHSINLKWVCLFVFAVCLLRTAQLGVRFLQNGLSAMMADDFALFQMDGIVGHLMIWIKPLCAILFYEWMKQKRKIVYLLLVGFAGGLLASSFIKYHIITFVLLLYIYCCLKDHRYFFKLGVGVLILIFAVFILNYLVSFVLRSMEVDSSFYLLHLWKYIAGGTINMQAVLSGPDSITLTVGQWLYDFFMPIPRMLLKGLTGAGDEINLFNPDMLAVGLNGEESNVVATLGYMLCQSSTLFAVAIVFLWGAVSEGVFYLSRARTSDAVKSFAAVFFAYNTLSFFSSFFRLSGPWEELIMAFVIVWVFSYHKRTVNVPSVSPL